MFCSQCGSKLPDGAVVCPDCGAKVEKEINFSDVTNYASQRMQQASNGIQNQMEHFRQTQAEVSESRKIKNVSDMFVDPQEQQKAVIGGGYLSNMLHSGVLGKGFGVLTDRRLYFRGKSYSKVNSHFVKTDEDRTIDIQDITSSGFSYAKNITWLFLVGVSLLVALFWFILGVGSDSVDTSEMLVFVACLFVLAAIGLFVAYMVLKQAIYTVTFPGGNLSIRASSYGVREVRAFDKVLHLEKDRFLRSRR